MRWYLRGCPVCGGDLHDDLENRSRVTCMMCARSFDTTQLKRERLRPSAEPVGTASARRPGGDAGFPEQHTEQQAA
jgi:hypothetical protein